MYDDAFNDHLCFFRREEGIVDVCFYGLDLGHV